MTQSYRYLWESIKKDMCKMIKWYLKKGKLGLSTLNYFSIYTSCLLDEYTSEPGSFVGGLSAYVSKDPKTGELVCLTTSLHH